MVNFQNYVQIKLVLIFLLKYKKVLVKLEK
jgi:hypothetical protein